MGIIDQSRTWFARASQRRSHIVVVAALVSGFVLMPLAGVFAFKQASDGIADAAFREIQGQDPDQVIDKITDKVVNKVLGDLDPEALTADFVEQLSANVLKGQDVNVEDSVKRIEQSVGGDIRSMVGDVDVDALLAQASEQLQKAVMAEVEKIDLQQVANQVIAKVASKIDVDKLVNQLVSSVDIEKMVQQKLNSVNLTQLLLASLTGRR